MVFTSRCLLFFRLKILGFLFIIRHNVQTPHHSVDFQEQDQCPSLNVAVVSECDVLDNSLTNTVTDSEAIVSTVWM